MTTTRLTERIEGCLLGAAIGAEFALLPKLNATQVRSAQDIWDFPLRRPDDIQEVAHNVWSRGLTPFVNVGIAAYLHKGSRVTPEDFAEVLKQDAGVSGPVFAWDGIHSTQELLMEGMPPRVSGMGAAPCGLIAAAMPAVGIYHCADPEYAYLDGVELASVVQARLGADWAALSAAAIAAALAEDATAEHVVSAVHAIAHANNPDLFDELVFANIHPQHDDEYALQWFHYLGQGFRRKEEHWVEANPLRFTLPLLARFAGDPRRLFALSAGTPSIFGDNALMRRMVPTILCGAIAGALHGAQIFPSEWRAWAEPVAESWYPITRVVEARLQCEREVIRVTEQLRDTPCNGRSLLQDKIYGCLLASAIGNAMGSPVECRMYWEIDEQYPEHVTTVLEPQRLESEDDNQMAMLLMETYLDRAGLPVMARHFGKTWHDRLNRNHFFPLCMGHAYDLIRDGWDARITGHWSVVTGSTVMCMEPAGIYHLGDPDYAAIDAAAISYMYQRGLDMTAASMLAATVATALRPDATVDSVLQAALDAAPRGPLRTFDQRPFASVYDYLSRCLEIAGKYDDVLAARAELYEKCLLYHMIDPLELWGLSLAMVKISRGDVRQAAIGGTNIGRDSDTIAGRAAMLSGAISGSASVPAEWKALFSPASLTRIAHHAGRVAEMLVTQKLNRLHARQGQVIIAHGQT